LIVIDDASPDRSAEVLSDIQDVRLRLIQLDKNQGCSHAITMGFALAQGQYIARFDGDDAWPADALESLASALDANPDAVVAYGNIETIDQHDRLGGVGIDRPPGPNKRCEFELLLQRHYTCAPAMLSRRAAWADLAPWHERFARGLGDWYYNLALALQGPFVYVDQVTAFYRVHALGMHYVGMKGQHIENSVRFLLDTMLPKLAERHSALEPKAIYAAHLRNLANSYFASDMPSDALKRKPSVFWHRASALPALASLTIGKSRYDAIKRWFRRG
jgi:glycosyltransferase involved in cell wall biosynthesis